MILELSFLVRHSGHSQLPAFWAAANCAKVVPVPAGFATGSIFSPRAELLSPSPSSGRSVSGALLWQSSTTPFQVLASSAVLNFRANSSLVTSPSEKSPAVQVHALSLVARGLNSMALVSMWLQQTFSTCSRLIRNLTLPDPLFFRILKSPSPLSFHSLLSGTNLNNLALFENRTSSSSSPVLTSTSSGKGMTGSK